MRAIRTMIGCNFESRNEPNTFLNNSKSSCAHQFYGKHFISNFLECDSSQLANNSGIIETMREGIALSGAKILETSFHIFEGGGMTALFLLSESHASIHTYPEQISCFIDMFTCGEKCDPQQFANLLKSFLKPQKTLDKFVLRDATKLGE